MADGPRIVSLRPIVPGIRSVGTCAERPASAEEAVFRRWEADRAADTEGDFVNYCRLKATASWTTLGNPSVSVH